MKLLTLDFETYYDKEYSLSKLTTEEYIRDARFEAIGVSVKVDDQPAVWFSGTHKQIGTFLKNFDFENSRVLAHNTMFDGAILLWRFGIRAKYYHDTLSMARPAHAATVGGSLAKLVKHYELGEKGTEVVNALGKRRADFSPDELEAYGRYCINDTELTYKLFGVLSPDTPTNEMDIIDLMLRMFIDPVILLDGDKLEEHLNEVVGKREALLASLGGIEKTAIMSNLQLAQLLTSLGVDPPLKVSPATGKATYAFSKNDADFKALLEHDNPQVQTLVAARLGLKSTLEETRTRTLLGIARRGSLPVPLLYWGAHTGRASGSDKINLQNLPARGGNTTLRDAMLPPPGHVIIAGDSAQIEARINAYISGESELVEAFRQKRDIYSEFATSIYSYPVSKANKVERFVGKTCIGLGSLVLCERGWVPIEQVTPTDRVWDGQEWVCHGGVVFNGWKKTVPLCGIWLTPDHLVWSGTQWLEAHCVVQDESIQSQALVHAAENLPSPATYGGSVPGSKNSLSNATAGVLSTQLTGTTSKILGRLAARYALEARGLRNAIGSTLKRYLTILTEPGSLIAFPQRLPAVIQLPQIGLNTTVEGESAFATNGVKTGQHSYAISKRYRGGMTQTYRWTELITAKGTSRGTSDSLRASRTCATEERWQTLRPVFDILNCGSRNRFTVLTERGPLIVHNCILGLGYSMSAAKLKLTLSNGNPPINMPLDEATRIVNIYRNKYSRIRMLWYIVDDEMRRVVESSTAGGLSYISTPTVRLLWSREHGLYMPSGTRLRYPNLRNVMVGSEKKVAYDNRYGHTFLYGGKVVENIVQALARNVVFEQMVTIHNKLKKYDLVKGKRFRVVLTVHDEIVVVAPEESAEAVKAMMEEVMSTAPLWAPKLPIACEVAIGPTYGSCK